MLPLGPRSERAHARGRLAHLYAERGSSDSLIHSMLCAEPGGGGADAMPFIWAAARARTLRARCLSMAAWRSISAACRSTAAASASMARWSVECGA